MAFVKKATATFFVMAVTGITIAVLPKYSGPVLSSFVFGSILFTVIFAIKSLVEPGTGGDKAFSVLVAPLLGMAVSAFFVALFLFWRVFVGLAVLIILGIIVKGIWAYAHRDTG